MEQQVAENAEAQRQIILRQAQAMVHFEADKLRHEEHQALYERQLASSRAESTLSEQANIYRNEEMSLIWNLQLELDEVGRNSDLQLTEMQH